MWSSGAGGGTGALRNGVEDQVGPGDLECAGRTVDPLDRQVGADHYEPPCRTAPAVVVAAERVGDRTFGVEVGEQRDADAQVVLERLVRVGRVDRYAVHLDALGLEIGENLVVDVQLVRADRREVERVEDEHGALSLQVAQCDLVSVLIGKREVRRGRAYLDHARYRRRPSSLMSSR